MEPIYLDHNAATPIRPEAVEAMDRCYAECQANPASRHRPGQSARKILEQARTKIAAILGADLSPPRGDRLIFTGGGTEANNLALLGMAVRPMEEGQRNNSPRLSREGMRGNSPRPLAGEEHRNNSPRPLAGEGQGVRVVAPGRIIISAGEHQSVIGPAERLLEQGWRMDALGLTPQGVVRAERLSPLLGDDTRLVSVLLANHETGVIQPIERLAAVCNEAGVPLHTDAVQAAGKVPVDFRSLGAAAMTVSAHKFQGPPGIGALILRRDVKISPILFGGGHQSGLRPGTEPVALAVGMAAALDLWHNERKEYAKRLTEVRDRFETRLRAALPGVVVHGAGAKRLPQTSGVAFPGIDGETLLGALDSAGVACSVGAACSSDSAELSPMLRAMDLPKGLIASSLRFSFGATNTAAEIDEAVRRIAEACRRLNG
ncbi:MAG: cysteine desulfurase [Pirellulales bacterium]|nr:cysteine desulfurase [Pirellulales bacterium]